MSIDPVIEQTLEAFAKRRRNLIIFRGACAGLVTLLIAMAAFAICDWMFFLNDGARWILSSIAYASVGVVVWLTCLRLVLRIPGPAKMARLIESAEPRLREDLISAVELGDPESAKAWDSEEFRQLLQADVAHRVQGVNVNTLLPSKMIKRWIMGAGISVGLCILLLILPGLNFGQRLSRALFPMADIERVSLTKVTIVEPANGDTAVPQGEQVEVVIKLDGPGVAPGIGGDSVALETFIEGERKRVRMNAVGGKEREYKATVRIGRENVNYRIRANDAQTRKYLIVSRERPHVVKFSKTYKYPDYTLTEPATKADKNGDLAAVEGTEVELVLETNQLINLAQLKIDQGAPGGEKIIPLAAELNPDGSVAKRLRGKVKLDKSGTYKVHLVAAQTGFKNKFSPEYVLKAEPDLVPRVLMSEPARATLVPPDEIVAMRGSASDDWALARIEQHFRINGKDWTKVQIAKFDDAKKKFEIERDWDLYELKLDPGDELLTKLVAIDRKGGVGETKPIRVVIGSRGFDPKRLNSIVSAQKAYDAMMNLSKAADELRTYVHTAHAKASGNANPGAVVERQQAVLDANESLTRFNDQVVQCNAAIRTAIQQSAAGRASRDLVLAGRIVTRASMEAMVNMHRLLATADGPDPASTLQKAKTASDAVNQLTATLADHYSHLLAANQLTAVSADLTDMSRLLTDAVARATEPNAPETAKKRLARRMKALNGQVQVVEGLLTDLSTRNESARADGDRLKQRIITIKTAAAQAANAPTVKTDLAFALDKSLGFVRELRGKAQTARTDMMQQAGTMHAAGVHASEQATKFAQMKKALSDKAAAGEFDTLQRDAEATKQQKTKTALAFEWPIAQLKSRASLEEARPDANSQFVADTSRAAGAIDGLRVKAMDGADGAKAIEELTGVANAVRVINVIHRLDDLAAVVNRMQQDEKRIAPLTASNDWSWAESQFESLEKHMRDAELNAEAITIVATARTSDDFTAVHNEMDLRPATNHNNTKVNLQLKHLGGELARARSLLNDAHKQARQALANVAPRLAEQIADAAKRAREIEQEMKQAAEAAAENEANENADEAKEQLAELQKLAEELEALREALRRDANEQDILRREGRERARDADDALAMLDQQPREAEQQLRNAAQAEQQQQQQQALNQAAHAQNELAQRLEQLAQHFQNLENPRNQEQLAQSREQLRAAEEELGVRERLDAQQEQLEQLAELAQLSPQQALERLEQELAQNRQMQQELNDLTRETLEGAQQDLQQAANQQEQVNRQLADAQMTPQQRANRAVEQLAQLGREAQQLAQNQVEQARQAREGEAPAEPLAREDNEPAQQELRPPEATEQNPFEIEPEPVEQENHDPVAQALAQVQRALEDVAEQAENVDDNADARELGAEAGALSEPLQQAAEQLRQAADQAAEQLREAREAAQANAAQNAEQNNQPNEQGQPAENAQANNDQQNNDDTENQNNEQFAERAEQAAEAANQQAEQAAEAAQEAAENAQQLARASRAARQANRPDVAAEAARQSAQQAAESANQAQQALNAAQRSEQAAQVAEAAAPESENAQAANEAAQDAQQQAANATQQAQQAANAARQAAIQNQRAQADAIAQRRDEANREDDPDDPDAVDLADRAAAEAAQQAAEAADRADDAARAAQEAQEATEQDPQENRRLAQAQNLAQQQAQQAAAEALEAAREAIEQAADAAAAAQAVSEAFEGSPDQSIQQQLAQAAQEQAERAAARSEQLAERAEAAAEAAEQPQQLADALPDEEVNPFQEELENNQLPQGEQGAQPEAGQPQQQPGQPQQAQGQQPQQNPGAQVPQLADNAAQQAEQLAQRAQELAEQLQQLAQDPQLAQNQDNNPFNEENPFEEPLDNNPFENEPGEAGNLPEGAEPGEALNPLENPQLADAAEAQPQIAQDVQQAAEDIARAQRHEQRLNNNPLAESLGQIQEGTQQAQQAQQAAQQLAQNPAPEGAEPFGQQAQEVIEEQAENLGNLLEPGEGPDPFAEPGVPEGAEPGEPGFPEAGEPGAPESGEPGFPEAGEPGAPEAGQPGAPEAGQPGPPEAGQPGTPEAGQPGAPEAGQPGAPGQGQLAPETARQLAEALDQLDQQLNQSQGSPSGQQGQPGQGQPGQAQGQPGQSQGQPGQPSQGQPGQPSQGQPGQVQGQGQPGQAQGQGQPGQAQGQGQPGQPSGQQGQPGQGQGGPGGQGQGQNTQAGQPNGQQGQNGQQGNNASNALQQAAQAQAQAIAQARSGNNQSSPPQSQGAPVGGGVSPNNDNGGASVNAGAMPYRNLPGMEALKQKDWAKLPKKLAKDLLEGSRENVSPEYRQAVEAYFRAIAEKAREKK